jgi:glycosyltransferase involved in cell wall biosynthesis
MFSSIPAPPTTILFFDHTAKMGGGEIALLHLVTHLDRKRFEPVVVLADDGPLCAKLSEAGVETHVLPLSNRVAEVRKDSLKGPRAVSGKQIGEILRYIWRLRAFARARGAEIVHTNSLKADILGGLAARLAGIPLVWHIRDRISDDYLPPKAARIFRILCQILPNYLAVNSAATLEALQLPAHLNQRVQKNGVIHDGLPWLEDARNSGEPPADASVDAPAEAAAQRSQVPCIGLVGRISPWKGQDVFLRAAAMVREKYPHARFQIIGAPLFGEEAYEAELHQLSEELGLTSSVEWLGFRTDVLPLVSRLTMLVHASKTGEPFGQVVVEAMMTERPVVATRGGGIPEIVLHEQTGLLVPMNDAPAMAAAILRLLDDPARAQAMGQAGQARYATHFTIGHTVAKVSRLFEDVLLDQKKWPRNIGRQLFWLAALVLVIGRVLNRDAAPRAKSQRRSTDAS